MGFAVYATVDAGEAIAFERVKSLKLSGPDGLVARHVRTIAPEGETSLWHLTDSQLLAHAAIDPAGKVVVFDLEPSSATRVCLYELVRIAGESSDDTTEMVMQFKILYGGEPPGGAEAFKRSFRLPKASSQTQISETLVLSGGLKGGSWRWAMPDMTLGFAIVSRNA